jgi:hypothetical protein
VILPRERDSIALAVALVNTWDVLNDPPEHLDDVEMLQLILRAFGLEREAARATPADLAPVRAMRDRLRTAFEADDAGKAVEVLNGLAREADAVPQLEPGNGGWDLPLRHPAPAACHRAGRARVRRTPRRHRGGGLDALRPLRGLTVLLCVHRPLEEPQPPLLLRPLRRSRDTGCRSPQAQAARRRRV